MDRADPESSLALGVDIGGSKIAVALVDTSGRVLSAERIATEPRADALDRARTCAATILAGPPSRRVAALPVGVGVPELVDHSGRIESTGVVGWSTAEVLRAFDLGGPVRIVGDVWAAAVAEGRLGAGEGTSQMLYVNLGTGISHCLVVDGTPVLGAHGRALLSGSTTMTVLDRDTGRLVRGQVEDVASGRAIIERYRAATGRTASVADILDAAGDGEEIAGAIRDDLIAVLGSLVANLVDLLDPDRVVLGGGLATIDVVYRGVVATARPAIWFEGSRGVSIVPAALGADSGMIGAALLARSSLAERVDR